MATTAGGLPYPVGTDKVVDGDDAIKALALAQEEFNKSYYSPLGSLNAISGADTALVAIWLPNGYFDISFEATCDWSVTGTARYWFNLFSGAGAYFSWQQYVPGTSGTLRTVATIPGIALPGASTQIVAGVHQTGVTGGQANVMQARIMARRVIPVAG
jgi:hypothetical protein